MSSKMKASAAAAEPGNGSAKTGREKRARPRNPLGVSWTRNQKACERCAGGKRKCDCFQQQPCSRCSKAGRECLLDGVPTALYVAMERERKGQGAEYARRLQDSLPEAKVESVEASSRHLCSPRRARSFNHLPPPYLKMPGVASATTSCSPLGSPLSPEHGQPQRPRYHPIPPPIRLESPTFASSKMTFASDPMSSQSPLYPHHTPYPHLSFRPTSRQSLPFLNRSVSQLYPDPSFLDPHVYPGINPFPDPITPVSSSTSYPAPPPPPPPPHLLPHSPLPPLIIPSSTPITPDSALFTFCDIPPTATRVINHPETGGYVWHREGAEFEEFIDYGLGVDIIPTPIPAPVDTAGVSK
ncbi:hypothetical protein L204_105934 [Cryptococcus depauperatus]|nr:hypothetical protein L204_05057 [Cryptococcus depauperatus CBS 7855]